MALYRATFVCYTAKHTEEGNKMFINIDRDSNITIKKQLYDKLTCMILNNELAYGQKLPSSRELARSLQIARNTVVEVYEQLIAELYIATRKGSGTYVANKINRFTNTLLPQTKVTSKNKTDNINLIAGTPDLRHFPKKLWLQSTRRIINHKNTDIFAYGNPNGYMPLRESLTKYLKTHKGISCIPEQIIISGGTKDAIRLLAMSMKKSVHILLTESPGLNFIPEIFSATGYKIKPMNIDNSGIITSELSESRRAFIYTSAAHQFPLGGTITIQRRHELIDFAEKHNHYIIEDDCDSEYRYKGAPINSLYQICSKFVIHVGTFSKTICPSLRLGYIVLPTELLVLAEKYTELIGNPPSTIIQATVNDLLYSGDYEKHIYRMTRIYKNKNKILIENLQKEFSDKIKINGKHSGLHIAVEFQNYKLKQSDKAVFSKYNLAVKFSNDYFTTEQNTQTNRLILSFAHLSQSEIIDAVKQLKKVYRILTS